MRILHTADWHLGKNLEGLSRLAEQEQFLRDLIEIADTKKIDLVVIAGDVFDSGNPSSKAQRLFYDALKQLSDGGKRLVLVIAGNHDSPEHIEAATALAYEHGIILSGTPKTVIEPGTYGCHRVIASGPGYIEAEIGSERAVILLVPYPSERRLNEVLYQGQADEERVQTYGERIGKLFDGLKTHFRPDTVNLVVSHLFAMGSIEGGSERSMQLGGSYLVSGECFPKEAQYIALGHIHKPQIVPNTEGKARYSGSPQAYHRKEANTPKKCLIVDVKAGQKATVEDVLLKVYKPIETWRIEGIDNAIAYCREHRDRNCYVYLEVVCDRYIREDEIKQMKEAKADIVEIIPVFTGQKEEEIRQQLQDLSFEEMFRAFYRKQKQVDPDQEVLDLLMSIVGKEGDDEADLVVDSGIA